jgi:hypothetical protein
MLKIADWLSIAVIGLVTVFVFLSISYYNFLIGPNSEGPTTTVEPSSSFIQIIFLSIGPAIILTIFMRPLSEGNSKMPFVLLIAAGIILIMGMIFVSSLIPKVKFIDMPEWITYVPFIFIIFGIVLLIMGMISFKNYMKMRPREWRE